MQKTLTLEGKQVKAVSSAILPRLYRFHFGKDLIMEMEKLRKSYTQDPESVDFTPVENLCWLMLKEGGEDVGETPEEWLRTLTDISSVYTLSADVMQLWQESQATTSRPKKK